MRLGVGSCYITAYLLNVFFVFALVIYFTFSFCFFCSFALTFWGILRALFPGISPRYGGSPGSAVYREFDPTGSDLGLCVHVTLDFSQANLGALSASIMGLHVGTPEADVPKVGDVQWTNLIWTSSAQTSVNAMASGNVCIEDESQRDDRFGHCYCHRSPPPSPPPPVPPPPVPPPPPSPPPPFPPGGVVCLDRCMSIEQSGTVDLASDATCDDGGDGSAFAVCAFGMDCKDCGKRLLDCHIHCEDATTEILARARCAEVLEAEGSDVKRCWASRWDVTGATLGADVGSARYACRCVSFSPPLPPPYAAVLVKV